MRYNEEFNRNSSHAQPPTHVLKNKWNIFPKLVDLVTWIVIVKASLSRKYFSGTCKHYLYSVVFSSEFIISRIFVVYTVNFEYSYIFLFMLSPFSIVSPTAVKPA